MNHALVTGATGFIGTHLVPALIKKGARVTALVRDPSKCRFFGPGVEIIEGDIFDAEALKKAGRNADTVFHLVAMSHNFVNEKKNGRRVSSY